jgi:hypothetical protein
MALSRPGPSFHRQGPAQSFRHFAGPQARRVLVKLRQGGIAVAADDLAHQADFPYPHLLAKHGVSQLQLDQGDR